MIKESGVSVIICCHNSSKRIGNTLMHLAEQIVHQVYCYEIILVDNNCVDDTIVTALKCWNSYGNPFPLHVIKQPKPGLTFARQQGIDTANFEYVILCDDDNWLCKDYLERTINLFEILPDVTIIGGIGEAVFESNPPEWFHQLKGFGYAVGDEGRSSGYTDSVYGAGMAIRKSIFNKLIKVDTTFILSDRKGTALSSGGDVEICLIFNRAGYKIYMENNLCFKHFITTERLRWDYYLQLRKAFGVAIAYLQAYNLMSDSVIKDDLKDYVKKVSIYIIFLCRRIHFFLFPHFFKNANCAGFTQILSMKRTLLLNSKLISELSKKINHPAK